jgi:hypothetical protein
VLTLYTTPVVFLYLARLQSWLAGGDKAKPVAAPADVHAVAAE